MDARRLRRRTTEERVTVPVFHVQTLGDVRLARDGGESIALRRKPLALLAYLARRAPRAVPRAELATLLWGDRSEDRARQSLRQALLELRQAVGDVVEVTADAVRLPDDVVALDVVEFERDARDGRDETAAARWRGDFFPNAAGDRQRRASSSGSTASGRRRSAA
jgi:DNA-binding SARP family transcriptional activator